MKEKTDDIDILEEFIKYYYAEKAQKDIKNKAIIVGEDDIQAISNLISENKELKDENKKLVLGKFREVASKNDYIKENYIEKSKVEEKIEEIEKKFKEETNPNILVTLKILKDEFQSLLGKE